MSQLLCLLSEKRSSLKEMNVLPWISNYFLLKVVLLSEEKLMFRQAKKKVSITNTYLFILPLQTPLLYSKTGVFRGIRYFFFFLLKNIDCGTR